MDTEIKHLLLAQVVAILAWMTKDLFLASRTQSRKNTEDIGALKVGLARVERDLNAAHSSIRELKGKL